MINTTLEGMDGELVLTFERDKTRRARRKPDHGQVHAGHQSKDTDYDSDQLLEPYKSRHQIESRFLALKNNLKIRPIFLQSEERIKSLILVNILALLVYSLIEWVCQQKRLATKHHNRLLAIDYGQTYVP